MCVYWSDLPNVLTHQLQLACVCGTETETKILSNSFAEKMCALAQGGRHLIRYQLLLQSQFRQLHW